MVALAIGSMVASSSHAKAFDIMDGCPEPIVEVFAEAGAREMCAIAKCESHWDNTAVGAAGELSYVQIHPVHFGRFSPTRLHTDPWYAAWAALELSSYGANLGPWRSSRGCWGAYL